MARGRKDDGAQGQDPQLRKLSEVLMEFVGEIVPEDASQEEFGQSVELAVVLWNVALLPEERRGEILWRMSQRASRADDPFFSGRLHELVDLRRQLYGGDHRLVVDFRIEETKRGRMLWVTSANADEQGQAGA